MGITARNGFLGALASAFILSACGGGGGTPSAGTSPGAGTTASEWPSTGTYSVVLRPSGSLTAKDVSASLSLVHPEMPTKEFVVDDTAQIPAVGLQLWKGTYNAAQLEFTDVLPVAYVDATSTRLRMVPLKANGARPQTVTSPGVTLCNANNIAAYDFVTPFNSQIAVPTPGLDGSCSTADDGQAVVTFSSSGLPTAKVDSSGKRLGFFRSAANGQPDHWLIASPKGGINLVSFASGTSTVVVPEPTIPPTAAQVFVSVVSTNDLIVFTQNGVLKSVNAAGQVRTHSALTSPEGWKSAGVDSSFAFVYLNSGVAGASSTNWRILSLSRQDQATFTSATGTGYIAAADSSATTVYATLLGTTAFSVVQFDKYASWKQSNLFAPVNTGVVSVVAPLASGVLLAVHVDSKNNNSMNISYLSPDGKAWATVTGAMPFGQESTRFDTVSATFIPSAYHVASISPSSYLGFGLLYRFDMASRTNQLMAHLPDGSALGGLPTDFVYASPITPTAGFTGLAVARANTAGALIDASKAVYTWNTSTVTNNLTRTTVQQR